MNDNILGYRKQINKIGYDIDVDTYEAAHGEEITEDELWNICYNTDIELGKRGLNIYDSCKYLLSIGNLKKVD